MPKFGPYDALKNLKKLGLSHDDMKDFNPFDVLKQFSPNGIPGMGKLGKNPWIDNYIKEILAASGSSSNWNQNDIKGIKHKLHETDEKVIIRAVLPGLKNPDDLAVRLEGLDLYISGKMPDFDQDKESLKDFSHKVTLACVVSPTDAQASYKNGVLEITLMKDKTFNNHRKIEVDFI